MNRNLITNTVRFLGLLILQIFLFDQINFMGFINPMVYLLFIVLYPIENKRWDVMIISFVLGIILDTFQDTGGAHAAACLTLAFTRPLWLRLVYGESYKMKNIKVLQSPFDRLLLLLVFCIVVHHIVFFSLVIFNGSQILYTLKLTLSIGAATLVVNTILLALFKPRVKS
ncbi:rod shape-determining protein MreD [Nonlabens dokdonensis]|nr:rod shape-determining protein MreD [Nonlabens dokdonensis]